MRKREEKENNNIASFTYVIRTTDAWARDNFISSLELIYLLYADLFWNPVNICISSIRSVGLRIIYKYLPKQFV